MQRDMRLRMLQTVENFPRGHTACPAHGNRPLPEPDKTVSTRLFTRRAGVHVDFHAHRHFHNLRSLPTHQGPPKRCWHDARAGIKTRLPSNVAQARNIDPAAIRTHLTPRHFPLGQAYFALGQEERGGGSTQHSVDPPIRRRFNFVSQQSLSASASAVFSSPLAPSACCAAVGCPCI
jgi:hypothetical protein